MQVKATQAGFYGCIREAGDVFVLASPDNFSKNWMVKAASEPEEEVPAVLQDDEPATSGKSAKGK